MYAKIRQDKGIEMKDTGSEIVWIMWKPDSVALMAPVQ